MKQFAPDDTARCIPNENIPEFYALFWTTNVSFNIKTWQKSNKTKKLR